MTAALYVDARTGEVTPDEVVRNVARDFWRAEAAVKEARDELARLVAERSDRAADLQAIVPAEGRVDAGDAWVVMEPAPRPPQRVDRRGAERHREELLTLGLGRESLDYHAPTAAEVKAEKARLIAAGIPLSDLLPEPMAGPAIPRVVPK